MSQYKYNDRAQQLPVSNANCRSPRMCVCGAVHLRACGCMGPKQSAICLRSVRRPSVLSPSAPSPRDVLSKASSIPSAPATPLPKTTKPRGFDEPRSAHVSPPDERHNDNSGLGNSDGPQACPKAVCAITSTKKWNRLFYGSKNPHKPIAPRTHQTALAFVHPQPSPLPRGALLPVVAGIYEAAAKGFCAACLRGGSESPSGFCAAGLNGGSGATWDHGTPVATSRATMPTVTSS